MLDWADSETKLNLRLLVETCRRPDARVVIWVGAGASSWCGYPRWPELAEKFHRHFARFEPTYDRAIGLRHFEARRFPELFQECSNANRWHYHTMLVKELAPRLPTSVYERLLRALRALPSPMLITTNADELLEKNIPLAETVNWPDMERVPSLIAERRPFVCKLHGSVSHVETLVFTSAQYAERTSNPQTRYALERVFSSASVVFLGYGIQDAHVIDGLKAAGDWAKVFGIGPHFAVLPVNQAIDVPGLRCIRYRPEPHKDHRAALQVLEELVARQSVVPSQIPAAPPKLRSAHLLSDLLPPGSWGTSQTLTLHRINDIEREAMQSALAHEMIVGNGYTDDEFPNRASMAMHDLIVGLLCFDEVVAPVQSIDRLHAMLGETMLWTLIREGALQLIDWPRQEAVAFVEVGGAVGGIGSFSLCNADHSRKSVGDMLKRLMRPLPGREAAAEKLHAELEPMIRRIADEEEGAIPDMVRSLLARPSVRQVLGISDGTPVANVPRWQVFSVLRLAHVVKVGAACRALQIASAKLEFGAAALAGPAFAAAFGTESVDDCAGYVVAGRYSADLGMIARQTPDLLQNVLQFRETTMGSDLRRHVLECLAISQGADVAVAINNGLRMGIARRFLDAARDQFVALMTAQPSGGRPHPAIWNDRRSAEDDVSRWRLKSGSALIDWCRKNRIGLNDRCPCGSGDKLKHCCAETLGVSRHV
jgi:NAD-dependent SIR2 family protein deacetylase